MKSEATAQVMDGHINYNPLLIRLSLSFNSAIKLPQGIVTRFTKDFSVLQRVW